MAEIKRSIVRAHESATQRGAGYEPTEARIWHGTHTDVSGLTPDYVAITGRRGGVQIQRV